MDLPKRKPTRLKEYDYSTPGAYFITICTHNKKYLLSNIVGAIHESPENKLTQYGKFAEEVIKILPDRFNVSIPKYIIMPNHIHLIIEIINDSEKRAIRCETLSVSVYDLHCLQCSSPYNTIVPLLTKWWDF